MLFWRFSPILHREKQHGDQTHELGGKRVQRVPGIITDASDRDRTHELGGKRGPTPLAPCVDRTDQIYRSGRWVTRMALTIGSPKPRRVRKRRLSCPSVTVTKKVLS